MNRHLPQHKLARPAETSLALDGAALKDASRRLWRRPRGTARPSLTAAPSSAEGTSGQDEKTAPQPNQKTMLRVFGRRTTHALQKADMFMRHEQPITSSLLAPSRNVPSAQS